MQHGFLYLPISTHGFAMSAILDTSTTWLFISPRLADKLPVTIQDVIPLTITLPMGKTLGTT